ncbi:hypothetical protein L0F63_001269 [Massospora cicadina]|nr:hypothetical protein L0F63_001269 [Massospora cicadina]
MSGLNLLSNNMYYQEEAEHPVQDAAAETPTDKAQRERDERRQITIKYRDLIKRYQDLKEAPEEGTFEALPAGVEEANALFANVKGTYEASLDSKVLILTSELGMKHAQNLKIDGTVFDRTKYFNCLQKYAGTLPFTMEGTAEARPRARPADWEKLGLLAARSMNRAPTIDFMLGPLNIKAHVRKRITRTREAAVAAQAVRPKQIGQSDLNQQENDTTANVQMIYGLLKRNGPYKLFEFIINPYSFGQSVENLFYLSFLIRDGKASITEQNGELVLDCATPPTQEDYTSGVQKKQLIMELDSFTWARLIEIYHIESPIIPDRTPISTLGSTLS